MTKLDTRTARAWVDENDDWWISVGGTDIMTRLWNEEDLAYGHFPGNSLGHRLIEMGWMPDRRRMLTPTTESRMERLILSALAGWAPSPSAEKVWTMPVYREVD